jgi:hypothetical protein
MWIDVNPTTSKQSLSVFDDVETFLKKREEGSFMGISADQGQDSLCSSPGPWLENSIRSYLISYKN